MKPLLLRPHHSDYHNTLHGGSPKVVCLRYRIEILQVGTSSYPHQSQSHRTSTVDLGDRAFGTQM